MKKKILFALILLILALIILFIDPILLKPAPKVASPDLFTQVKHSFSSPQEKDIGIYLDQASLEADSQKKYAKFQRAYSLMIFSYNLNKNTDKKYAILAFRNYLTTFKEFQAADLEIPK